MRDFYDACGLEPETVRSLYAASRASVVQCLGKIEAAPTEAGILGTLKAAQFDIAMMEQLRAAYHYQTGEDIEDEFDDWPHSIGPKLKRLSSNAEPQPANLSLEEAMSIGKFTLSELLPLYSSYLEWI